MWSPEQERAIKLVRRFLKDPDHQIFLLFGYAGTGKTTIAQEFCCGDASTTFVAYTGKAAHVLRRRGCEPVSTIHRLIYNHEFDEKKNVYTRVLKSPDELEDVDLLVVDEASMVNEELARDLLGFGIKTLVIADPAQLSPPDGKEGYFVQFEPDVMLTQIHRQARDNPILRLADDVRRGKGLWRKGHYDRGVKITNLMGADDDIADHDVIGWNE